MDDAVGERGLNRLPQRRLNLIDGSISSHCSILNSPERLEQIIQSKRLESILCDLDYDFLRGNQQRKNRATEVYENRRQKYEEKQVMENEDRLRGLESCEALVRSVLTFGMYHINNLKLKELQMILCYQFGL